MLPGPVGGTWRPRRLFYSNPMSICFGVQGASEIVMGAKNLLSGCFTPVPPDRNRGKNHGDFFSQKKYFLDFWGNFQENQAKCRKIEIVKISKKVDFVRNVIGMIQKYFC